MSALSVLRLVPALSAFVLLAGCAYLNTGAPPPAVAARGDFRPDGPVDLGDYQKASADKVLAGFSAHVAKRYAAGAPMAAAVKDLAGNKFECGPAKAAEGDPPDQVCRRVIKAGGCDHTWQVHLFDDDGGRATVARVRGLYDRACGADDLLGG